MTPHGSARISVSVVSDDRLFSDAVIQFLAEQQDIIARAGRSATASLDPTDGCDILLLDARNDTAASLPNHPTIFLSAPDEDAWAISALSAGARGVLTRADSRDDLVHAIHVVHNGGIWARRRWLAQCLLMVVSASRRRGARWDAVDSRLSPREREVLRQAATGVCNKEIAERLSISEATVKVHVSRIFQKLGVSSRAALAAAYNEVPSLGPVPLPPGRTTSSPRNHPFG